MVYTSTSAVIHTFITMEDGSSVRTKVAQYFINKKFEELESKKAKLKIDDLTLLQALPQPVDGTYGANEPDHGADEPPQLPPFFPPAPGDDNVSWERVLEVFRTRRPIIRDGRRSIPPPWYHVAIIGAGVAGLRTAMLLQRMGIPYKIFEASDRPGGRVYTYQFASRPPGNPQGNHDYYDVGTMRYPDNNANKETFKLFDELGLSSKKIRYVLSNEGDIRYYNSRCRICMGWL